MIIGNGLIASAFAGYEYCKNLLIFASGVSNSLETHLEPYERERKLLEKTIKEKKFI